MDPLSAVASGISIVSLGIQIADSIQKCLRFWKSVRGAPSDIGRIVEDLEALDEILNSAMAYHQGLQRSENSPQPVPLPRALQSCANRLMDVVRTISDLEQGFQARKLWTSLRTAFREEAINKVRRDLESAKSSLILSNQVVLSQLQQAQYRNLVAQQKNIAVITQSVAQISIAVAKRSMKRASRQHLARESRFEQGHVKELPCDEDDEPGICAKEEKAVTKRRPLPTSNSFKLRGLLRRGFSLYSQRALRDGRVVPEKSPVFKYAGLGDVEQLWNLFDQGLASPFDTDPGGYTPLHWAAFYIQPFACKVLIDLGADSNALATKYEFTPLGVISTAMLSLGTHSVDDVVDLTRQFVEHGCADPFIETKTGVPVYYAYEGTIDGLKILNNQDPFRGSMAAHGVEGWGVLHEQLYWASYYDPFLVERLRFWIMQGAYVNETKGLSTVLDIYSAPLGTSPLHVACLGHERFASKHRVLLLLKPGLLELLLDAGADIHAMDLNGDTPFRKIADRFRPEEYFRWFQMLWKLGVDLPGYIDFECSLYQDRLADFNPKKVWNSAIRYGLARRANLGEQGSLLAHVSELLEELLEEYRGIPVAEWHARSARNAREKPAYEVDEVDEADSPDVDLSEVDFSEADISEADVSEADDSEATSPDETRETAPETSTKIPPSRSSQTLPALDHQHLPTTETQIPTQPHVNTAKAPQLKRKKAAADLKCEETGMDVEQTTGTWV